MKMNSGNKTVLSGVDRIANKINIMMFIAVGLRDGVIISFFTLAVYDLAYLISSVRLNVAVIVYVVQIRYAIQFPIEPYGVFILYGSCSLFINMDNVVLATTFLTVAGCIYMFRPLQFKHIFTNYWSVVTMAIFAIVLLASIQHFRST